MRLKSFTRYATLQGRFSGDKVQADIKYVPDECICFSTYGCRYYKITGIDDEYNWKRVLKIVKVKNLHETTKYLKELDRWMGFRTHTLQVDNGIGFSYSTLGEWQGGMQSQRAVTKG